MRTLGVLLAGGQGKRLGGEVPKALAMCAGRTLLERAAATLATVCERVVVVAPGDMVLPEVDGAERVADPPDAAGPLAGLVAGLRARTFEEALVLAVDMPLLTSATLLSLRALRGAATAVVPAPGGIPQPLAAWYMAGVQASLAHALASGERSVTRAVLALSPAIVNDATLASLPGGLGVWHNVNTAAELAAAERRLLTPHTGA